MIPVLPQRASCGARGKAYVADLRKQADHSFEDTPCVNTSFLTKKREYEETVAHGEESSIH
jgi:hypothetical protein